MGIPIGLDYSWFLIFALLYFPVRSITLFIFLRTVQELGA
jgi:hypothetical protein